MKNLKLMWGGLLLLASLVACKKDKANPNDPNNPENVVQITKSDLTPYYLVAERKTGDQKLSVMTFTQEENNLKVNLHRQGYLRVIDATINNNTLTFDLDGTGSTVFSFLFEKNASGKLTLKSYQLTDKNNAAQGFDYAVLINSSSSPNYENADFKTGNLLFRFTAAKTIDWDIRERQVGTKYYPPPINQTLPVMGVAPEVSIPYYGLAAASFKANSDFIGAMVPNWKGANTTTMIIEHNNIIYLANKQ